MSDATATTSRRRTHRGIALLVTLLTSVVLGLIVFQMKTTTTVAYDRIMVRTWERQCRRALDSVPGLAALMLSEAVADMAIDTPADEWARPKYFDIGEVRVQITIEDCARRFDLKPLLEADPGLLVTNKERFVLFAENCGVGADLAGRLAEAIAYEAEARRLEDTTFVEVEQETTGTTTRTTAANQTTQELVPVWLEDFLSLPELSDDDRRALRSAYVERIDPVTQDMVVVRFLDQITIWRSNQMNVNTAGREVLIAELPMLQNQQQVIDEIIVERAEEPFQNIAQIRNVPGLTEEEANEVAKAVRLNSQRFRVTATARMRDRELPIPVREGRMTLILERRGVSTFYTLWRRVNV